MKASALYCQIAVGYSEAILILRYKKIRHLLVLGFPGQKYFAIDYLGFLSCSHLQRYSQLIYVHL